MLKNPLQEYDLNINRELLIAGIDEAGRGSVFGDVCVALVVLDLSKEYFYINDSKKLSANQRLKALEEIKQKALYTDVECLSAQVIDEINILEATKLAMNNLINRLPKEISIVLIDHVKISNPEKQIISITKGDTLSLSIAAASVLAKVHRDALMDFYDFIYPQYGLKKHKGYLTTQHYENLLKFGRSPLHRQSFRYLKDENR
ncbi:MAG: ribonuclease HII [Acholeplasmatales bacterium]|jgi:ribonuclease HII|nr:ribonuclease HII [Acholeplasmatales bacterium]